MKMTKLLLCILSLLLTNPSHSQQPRQAVQKKPAANRRQPIRKQPMRRQPIRGNPAAARRQQPKKVPQQPAQVIQQKQPDQLTKAQESNISPVKTKYGMAIAQNKRDYQEDRFDQRRIIAIKNGDFFAIYDGHGGDKTSSYLQQNLAIYFTESLMRKPSVQEAFERAFFRAEFHALNQFDDGSTVIAVFIDEKNILHLAWVGDSRAVLEKNGAIDFATQDHKPNSKDEFDRIKKAGGTIQKDLVWRIYGLAISRSIGDKRLKDLGKDMIIAIPEYATIQLDSDNHFLILASDGLWDVISNQAAIDFVKNKLKTTSDLDAIAIDLQNEAIRLASGDNITICIIKLEIPKQVALAKKQEDLKKMPHASYWSRFWNWLRGKK